MDRIEGRIARLMDAHAKLVAKVEANPDHPKAEAWKARVLEYEASLESIKRFGKEVVSRNPVGVNIEVPVSGFSVKSHAPGR